MQRFLEFLTEDDGFERIEDKADSKRHTYQHSTKIGGNEVLVHFTHRYPHNGHYEASFSNYGHREPNNSLKVLNHVNNKTNEFIRNYKPKGLHFMTANSKKSKMYENYAKRMAKKHNGRIEQTNTGSHTSIHVHFPHH